MGSKKLKAPVVVKTVVSTILYLAVFAGTIVCLYNVFKTSENDRSIDDAFCKSGYIGYEYNIHNDHFERANMSASECMDRFGFQHGCCIEIHTRSRYRCGPRWDSLLRHCCF